MLRIQNGLMYARLCEHNNCVYIYSWHTNKHSYPFYLNFIYNALGLLFLKIYFLFSNDFVNNLKCVCFFFFLGKWFLRRRTNCCAVLLILFKLFRLSDSMKNQYINGFVHAAVVYLYMYIVYAQLLCSTCICTRWFHYRWVFLHWSCSTCCRWNGSMDSGREL